MELGTVLRRKCPCWSTTPFKVCSPGWGITVLRVVSQSLAQAEAGLWLQAQRELQVSLEAHGRYIHSLMEEARQPSEQVDHIPGAQMPHTMPHVRLNKMMSITHGDPAGPLTQISFHVIDSGILESSSHVSVHCFLVSNCNAVNRISLFSVSSEVFPLMHKLPWWEALQLNIFSFLFILATHLLMRS